MVFGIIWLAAVRCSEVLFGKVLLRCTERYSKVRSCAVSFYIGFVMMSGAKYSPVIYGVFGHGLVL